MGARGRNWLGLGPFAWPRLEKQLCATACEDRSEDSVSRMRVKWWNPVPPSSSS